MTEPGTRLGRSSFCAEEKLRYLGGAVLEAGKARGDRFRLGEDGHDRLGGFNSRAGMRNIGEGRHLARRSQRTLPGPLGRKCQAVTGKQHGLADYHTRLRGLDLLAPCAALEYGGMHLQTG